MDEHTREDVRKCSIEYLVREELNKDINITNNVIFTHNKKNQGDHLLSETKTKLENFNKQIFELERGERGEDKKKNLEALKQIRLKKEALIDLLIKLRREKSDRKDKYEELVEEV